MRSLCLFLAVMIGPSASAGETEPQLKLLATLEGASPREYALIAFSPDGKLLASADYTAKENLPVMSSVQVWDVAQRKVVATLRDAGGDLDKGVYSVTFSPDGKTLAATSSRKVTLFDLSSRKEKTSFKGCGGPVAFGPDSSTLVTATEHGGTVWDLSTGREKASLKGYGTSTMFSPDGKLLATGSGKYGSEGLPGAGEVTLWDAATGQEVAALGRSVKLKMNLRSLSDLKADGVPRRVLLKLAALNGTEFRSEEDFEKEFPLILDEILDKDQRKQYGDLVMRQVQTVRDGPEVVWSVAFSPDGKTLASASVLGSVFLWDVKSGRRTAMPLRFNPMGREEDINPAYAVAFSPDGSLLLVGTARGIKLWDVKKGGKVMAVSQPPAPAWAVAFSPDGKTLASAGWKAVLAPLRPLNPGDDEPTLRLWEYIPPRKTDARR